MKKIIKPWGFEKLLEYNKQYTLKKLFMKKGKRCSLQFHKKKKETIFILSGKLKIISGNTKKNLKSKIYTRGQSTTINPKVIHRMEGVTNSIYLEASTSQLNDVIRLEDDYNRI